MPHRLNTNILAMLGLSAALIADTRRAEACRMPLRRSSPAATYTPNGSPTPKVLVLVDRQTVLAEVARAELERMQREDEGGILQTLFDPFAHVGRLLQTLAPTLRRSPFADRGSYERALSGQRLRKSDVRRRARNQTRPQAHVVRCMRQTRKSH